MSPAGRLAACCLALACLTAGQAAGAASNVVKGKHCPHRVTTPHFVIEFSVPAEMGADYADLCEKAYKRLTSVFRLGPNELVWQGKCFIFLFAGHAEFLRFAVAVHGKTAAQSGGYTLIHKRNPVVVLFLHGSNHTKLKQTLIHEMTHVFLGLYKTEGRINTWLHEGFAQYFEFKHKPERSRLALSRTVAKALVARNRTVPLARFWRAYFPPTDAASYAQAWSLIDFMSSTKALRRKTGSFIIKLKEGKSQEQALQEAFGVTLPQFEALWKKHVLSSY